MVTLAQSDRNRAVAAFDDFMQVFRKLEKSQGDTSELISAAASASQSRAVETASTVRTSIIGLCAAALVLLSGGALLISRSIANPLHSGLTKLSSAVYELSSASDQISAAS